MDKKIDHTIVMAMTEAISTTVSDLQASQVDVAIDLVQNGSKAAPGQLATKLLLAKTGPQAGFSGEKEIECIAGSASNSIFLAAMFSWRHCVVAK